MSRNAANIISAQVIMKPDCVLGLATGSSPVGTYKQLIDGMKNWFNEPGAAFEKETHCVDLTESTIEANKRFFASEEEVPKQAYTMGIKNIMQAKKILVIVSGADYLSLSMWH